MNKQLHFSGFDVDCIELPAIPTGSYNNTNIYEYDLEHGVFLTAGPSAISSNNLIDLDGNTWHFYTSSNTLYIDIIKDGITVITKQLASILPSGFQLGSGQQYSRLFFLIFESSTRQLYYNYYLIMGQYLDSYFRCIGINNITTCQSSIDIVNFPNSGNWISGTSIQNAYTYELLNHLGQYVVIINAQNPTIASRLTYYYRGTPPFKSAVLFTQSEIEQYFTASLDIEGGSIEYCTISLDKNIYLYTSSQITPIVTVKSPNNNLLIKNTDYTVSYLDNVNVGTGQVIITGINLWSDTKRLYFTIVSGGDPYSSGGISTTGGGDGSFDNTTDTITIPSLPTLSSLQSSLINLWAPTQSQLGNLVSWLWSSAFDLDSLKKLFTSPMDMIMGLSIVPVSVPTTSDTVKFGLINSNVSMYKATQQYAIVDCGDINLEPFWGSYLDYSPYTKLDMFLPYIGYVHLDPDVMMDSTINVTYHIDVLSGSCVAFICSNTSILYTFMGDCAIHIPISANDWSSLYTSLARLVSNSATFAIGGANVGGVAGGVAGAAVGAASSMLTKSMKPIIGKSGSISASSAFLNLQKPHLVINRPRQALPELQNIYTGYPAFITSPLTSLLGYTEVESIHLDNVPATDAEIDEILEILHNGFVI